MISQNDLETLLRTLSRDQLINLGVGDADKPGWFRAQVVSHDVRAGRLIVTYVMDRPSDRSLEPGERVIVSALQSDQEAHSAPMQVEHSTSGPQPTVQLIMAGSWVPGDDRRHRVRVTVRIHANRARRWLGGAWHDLDATVVDFSSRGVGLVLDHEVHVGDRLSLAVPLDAGGPDLRVTLEVRHVQAVAGFAPTWRTGGLFRNILPADHERVIRFIFAELRSRR